MKLCCGRLRLLSHREQLTERVFEPLDRPTSLEVIGNTAYVVTLGGEIWKIDDVSDPPFGKSR